MSATTFSQQGLNRVATIDLMARMRDAAYWSADHLKNLMRWVRVLVGRICAKFGVAARWLGLGSGAVSPGGLASEVSSQPSPATSPANGRSLAPGLSGNVVAPLGATAANDDGTTVEFVGLPKNVRAAVGEFSSTIESILREPFVFDTDCNDMVTVQKRLIVQVDKAECMRLAYVVTLQEAEHIGRLIADAAEDDLSSPEDVAQHLAALGRMREETLTCATSIARRYHGIAQSAQVLSAAIKDPVQRMQMAHQVHETVAASSQRLDHAVEGPLGCSVTTEGFKPLLPMEKVLQIPEREDLSTDEEHLMEQFRP